MMRRMAIQAVYRRQHTSKPADGHKVFPYLLRGMAIERPDQAWAMGVTYIPMTHGFVYLAAVMDWFGRRLLAWRVSITMESDFCLDAVDKALARHGRPEIFNTDQGNQGNQFTSAAFTGSLSDNAIRIRMDARGSWRDNVLVERLWRSVKCEEVYLHAHDSAADAPAFEP
jgi:putative transposase